MSLRCSPLLQWLLVGGLMKFLGFRTRALISAHAPYSLSDWFREVYDPNLPTVFFPNTGTTTESIKYQIINRVSCIFLLHLTRLTRYGIEIE